MNLPTSMSSWQKTALALTLAVLVGYAFGRYAQPANVQIQTQTVIKEVQVVKHDTVTVTKELKRPDGTVETDTTVVDKDVSSTQIQDTTKTKETISNLKPQWKAQGSAGYNFNQLRPVYGAGVERRILGPIFVGVWGNNNSTAGLSVSLEF